MKIRRKYPNALTVGKYLVVNSLWDDGCISLADDATEKILHTWEPPIWFVNLYNRIVAGGKGGAA